MSLSGLKKQVLIQIAEEINVFVPSPPRVLALREAIENSDVYKNEREVFESVVETIKLDVKEREEQLQLEKEQLQLEKEQLQLEKEHEYQIAVERTKLAQIEKQLELEHIRSDLQSKTTGNVEVSGEVDNAPNIEYLLKSVKTLTMPLPSRSESFNFYFQSLERAFEIKKIPESFKAEILLNILGERASSLTVHMSVSDMSQYSKIKEAVLKEYQSSPQDVLSEFRKAQKFKDETYVQFASRLCATFDYYCQLREVSDFKGLCELIVSDKLFSTLDRDLQLHIGIKQENKWFKPHDMSKYIDVYMSSSGRGKTEPLPSSRASGNEAFKSNRFQGPKYGSKSFVAEVNKGPKCILCKNSHFLNLCPEFKKLSVKERVELVKESKLCFNCLGNHKVATCRSKLTCGVCKKKHNIYLHFTEGSDENRSSTSGENSVPPVDTTLNPNAQVFVSQESYPDQTVNLCAASSTSKVGSKMVLLSTATVQIADRYGRFHTARALLDNGSQSSFVSKQYAKKLDLKRNKLRVVVSGLNSSTSVIDASVRTKITNKDGSFEKIMEFLIVPSITDFAPTQQFDISNLDLENIRLADEGFNKPGSIDILLGAQVFYDLLKPGRLNQPGSELILQNSVFGFLCGGSVVVDSDQVVHCGLILEDLDKTLKQFWEVENFEVECDQEKDDNVFCEDHFMKTHYRDEKGKYVVSLPVDENINLGESKFIANKRLTGLLKRLDKNQELSELYNDFMLEYERLGHMQVTTDTPRYVMPHHGVLRPESVSTKLRVVFNASALTSSGYSLNDCLKTGDIQQDDLFSILLRFRKHKIVMTADIVKMYRQIWVNPSQTDLQCILWRGRAGEIGLYKLLTVTYGTKSAPFLATRVLKQLFQDEEKRFPLAAEAARDFYVDDILTGTEDMEGARELQAQLISALDAGGMELHKWSSNEASLLSSVQARDKAVSFDKQATAPIKTLGLSWDPGQDQFIFSTEPSTNAVTKRSILSHISSLFDPMGLLGPILIKAKIFIQRLWREKLSWDEELPDGLQREWKKFAESLSSLSAVHVSRRILCDGANEIHLIGFCDASKDGFGAVIYVRSKSLSGESKVSLLCSKSRVSPISKPLSIPRLELCGAELLTKLVVKVISALDVHFDRVLLYCDSTTVLSWLQAPPGSYKVFVANRVSKIQELSKSFTWNYVNTRNNPADLVSRGVWPNQIHQHSLWWNGPTFVSRFELADDSPANCRLTSDVEEGQKELKASRLAEDDSLVFFVSADCMSDMFDITNNFLKLIRVIAFVYRFIDNCRSRVLSGPLQKTELVKAKKFILKVVQHQAFPKELKLLGDKKPIKESGLSNLALFLDDDGLIRVGGRLTNSDLPFEAKHPILLPKSHKITEMIFNYYHVKCLHSGPQTLLYSVRQEYWALSGRNVARRVVHNCVTCFKANPKASSQIMAPLPKDRLKVSPTFSKTGLDLCGPFLIKYKNQRKGVFHKVYVCIFVCLVTKAVHIEVLSDLTSSALLACLKRFVSRRGLPSQILSDNAKNFCGAAAEIKRVLALFRQDLVSDYLASNGITWGFIPPRSPNFGGLWEAGVKSFKHHLKRCIGDHKLTFEEFLTVTNQVEAMLNSRPLTPMSSDPNDFSVLTAGHFLIGRPLTSLPETDVADTPTNRLSRWQLLTKLSQIIWKKWSLDYLNNLQQRSKWHFNTGNAVPGMLVLLKEDGLPLCNWRVGRIVGVTPGSDGKVRVVEVKTDKGVYKRGISNICILPISGA